MYCIARLSDKIITNIKKIFNAHPKAALAEQLIIVDVVLKVINFKHSVQLAQNRCQLN